MKYLISICNHATTTWHKDQKKEWDYIVDIKFPNVPADIPTEVVNTMSKYLHTHVTSHIEIIKLDDKNAEIYVYVAGEFTLSYYLFWRLIKAGINIIVPASERIIDKHNVRSFKFNQWRVINPTI